MATIEVVPAVLSHAFAIRNRLRAEDEEELHAMTGKPPAEAVVEAFRVSGRAFTVLAGGKPIALFGVYKPSILATTGVPWLVGTPEVLDHKRYFALHSKEYVARLMDGFDKLENYVYWKNRFSIRWLKWCGFTICEYADPIGPFGLPFLRFWLRREECAHP